ncbi:MAG: NusG domain II-containing protein, partial [Oscillospiraceae bacterium]|nr:NusG domain II-containing protein [Oscillospiraceae bacterium]
VGVVLAAVLLLRSHAGATVQVRVDGAVVNTFPLSGEVTYQIDGLGGTNLLVIQDGAAWIQEADCPDALCVNMGRISRSGQSVVCLPHKVVVEIIDETDGGDGPDVVAGWKP